MIKHLWVKKTTSGDSRPKTQDTKISTFLEVQRLKKKREQERKRIAQEKQRDLDRQKKNKAHFAIHGMTHKQWAEHQARVKKKTLVIPKVKKKTLVIPKVTPPQQGKNVRVSELQKYLRDQHGMNVSKDDINFGKLPFLI